MKYTTLNNETSNQWQEACLISAKRLMLAETTVPNQTIYYVALIRQRVCGSVLYNTRIGMEYMTLSAVKSCKSQERGVFMT